MSHVPPQEYYASLPKHIAGAGAFFHDPDGKVLLVKPSYRDTWEIPGGEVRLQDGELTGWTLAAPREWDDLLAPHMARRVRACASALATGTTAYLQYGRPLVGIL